MFVKEITYEDYNGETRTEKCYFNLSKGELIELEMSYDGGFSKYAQNILDRGLCQEIFGLFKMLITKAYGVKSDDGKRFIKNEQVLNDFLQSEAYSELLSELFIAGNEDKMSELFNGIIPRDIARNLKDQTAVLPDANA